MTKKLTKHFWFLDHCNSLQTDKTIWNNLKQSSNKGIFLRANNEIWSIINDLNSSYLVRSITGWTIMNYYEYVFTRGCVPSFFKSASICPIFKKGGELKCENYRTISFLFNSSETFERVMYSRVEKPLLFYLAYLS